MTKTQTHENLQAYYGKVLGHSDDLQTNACCCDSDSVPPEVREALKLIHHEITDRFYGCGSPIPPLLEGKTVLDLGCGTGRDAYILSKLVGKSGHVIGVDMTDEQLETARKHISHHTEAFGYNKANVEFRQGFIEDLQGMDIADDSVDIVISNCVINLSPDKPSVFREIFRVLKPGGELYFSDIFADRRIPEALKNDPVLYGECLGGAMYIEDFRRLLADVGCPDYRVTSEAVVTIDNPELEARIGFANFTSITVRAFKLASLEDICEDFGQTATYKGTIANHPHHFDLDDHHRFHTGKSMPVCGNTAAMVGETRFADHFTVGGDRSNHFGPFMRNSGPAAKPETPATSCC
ncbi:MAG: methyltransferase type 11 [Zetaproteobacteria bacterium CG12_big_fil_rev_8_21_14_0_65_55_1124]|nr:MAG: methyltransferase type 11 [Zetaproteobacteria bacterium CG1_02_55_237]PIS19139.1 MAG: methyltransferase type 11 [Zetaproteobacteria bacterium CG08_land_8_20_14_0_20_55_17]PIW43835.1 MAG: methyltransferase type 11 [Zetaproteobacteria bacterium CG12_big_fil_rev_8_21_14_0_65_55_1124]PIY52980.1 MAG: methyltransferase type 11 [Zetaproteobacteria bacterium CG_4_10_14_0_8_um_filter_55_43]PIZ37614.1 MAG: methyltransferase type 11 [Zetaproteobacteria bacterium CG_4_10_14_0_2_um_filter_55_20]PJB